MTRIAPIMPPRGYRFPWWWLLTSRQGYRKSMQGLFGGFCFCYNACRQGKCCKTGVIVCSKSAGFPGSERRRRVPRHPAPIRTHRLGGLTAGRGTLSTRNRIFFGEKSGRFSRIMRVGAPTGHGCEPRAQITHTKRAPVVAVSELGTNTQI